MSIKEIYADVTIIGDKAPTSLPVGRADALNARSQQTLEVVGVLDKLEPKGLKCNTSSTFSDGNFVSRQNDWWVSLKNTARPNFLMIGQADVEAAMHSMLDITCHHGHEALNIEEVTIDGEDYVRTTFADKVIVSRYAVGADGAKSLVRNTLNIPFEGDKPNMVWHVLDTFIDTDFPVCPEIITFQVAGQARISWIPRERGMARFYTLLEDNSAADQPRIEAEIRKFLAPYRVDFQRTEWFSIFEVKERVARTYFSPKRRIALAGDAAHIHSVNGGQGLNTGQADAFALAWRLLLALQGHATEALWQSYEDERRACAVGVIDVAAKLVRSTVKTAKEYVGMIEKNAGYITGMGVAYPEGVTPLVAGTAQGIFVPGHRAPDVFLHEEGEEPQRLYSARKYGKFLVLSLRGRSWAPPKDAKWAGFVDTWDVSGAPEKAPEADRAYACISNVPDKTSVEAGEAAFVVIRPDMYTGYVGEDVRGYLGKVFA
ncbi:FAD-dependent oxidoreductase, putative [Acanthamoeba castellanii str. Neff]|uniref:FAD-dependent oxidoreductase, putative n=1 Tax=Acanthamoeba castellanii (strain ATCC 30010 / Neff) TaxID=1257118 RepID=L8HFG5_ACACF|nr:FAD-dependent oxidoreductase, putative [Acanthamoeba castellanii str. Neff]ELR23151.1 FAD-dependent oxidoreductase, putative [Acanthamoeba castellanii str. Neff]